MFKDIPGYEGKYSIDEFGNILSFNYGKQKLLKQGKDKDGYSSIGLHKNNKGTTNCCLGIRWHKTTGGFFWKFKY